MLVNERDGCVFFLGGGWKLALNEGSEIQKRGPHHNGHMIEILNKCSMKVFNVFCLFFCRQHSFWPPTACLNGLTYGETG